MIVGKKATTSKPCRHLIRVWKHQTLERSFVLHNMIFKHLKESMCVLRKRETFCREKRVAHRKQANISWSNASHSFWSMSRNLWQSLSESIGVFMKRLVQATKTKSLFKIRGLWSIKKWDLKKVRSFLISYVAWNSNAELLKYFRKGLVLRVSNQENQAFENVYKCYT